MAEPREELARESANEEAVGIRLDSVDLNESQVSQRPETDDPPEYSTVLDQEAPPLDYEAPPFSYDAVLAMTLSDEQPAGTLSVQAPPSYMQLFGKENEEPDGVGHAGQHRRQRRRHTVRRGRREGSRSTLTWLPKDTKSCMKYGAITTVFVLGLILAISMITVGFVYYSTCSVREVPLYLIVAGFVFLVELILHCLLCTAQKYSNEDYFYNVVRKLDCLAFFLFVWLLVGSTWMFRAKRQPCGSDAVDYVIIGNNTDDVFVNRTDTIPDDELDCIDCPGGVYAFTVVLILMQYIVFLILAVCCCTKTVRSQQD